MTNKLSSWCFVLICALASASCASTQNLSALTESNNASRPTVSPEALFKRYWEASRIGNSHEIERLTALPPDKLLTCRSKTRSECLELLPQLKQEEERQKASGPVREMVIVPDTSMMRKHVPFRIKDGTWTSYVIGRSEIIDDEARFELELRGPDGRSAQDVLLSKVDGEWKLIAIAIPGDFLAFAPFVDPPPTNKKPAN